ncbi:MAG: hypothetical protein ACTHJM_03585 [Marmoricola sp.]
MSETPSGSEPERSAAEDEAWASIVENFGERAQLSEEDITPAPINLIPIEPEPMPSILESDDHFVPEEVPRVGLADGPRGAAWLGLLGAPTLFVIALLTGITVPSWLSLFAVVAFLVSLGYLISTMSRGHDDDPWDDGARV